MRRILIWTIAAAVVLIGLSERVRAVQMHFVQDTDHNLSTSGRGPFRSDDETEVCIFCHTPHGGDPANPLWNHYSTAGTFKIYSGSATLDLNPVDLGGNFTLPAQSRSRLCLTCHDGVTAFNNLINPSNVTGGNPAWTAGTWSDLGIPAGSGPYLGTDLRNMHPIGFRYDQVADSDLKTVAEVEAAGLKFYAGTLGDKYLECPTCHDPHIDADRINGGTDTGTRIGYPEYASFLRRPNSSSMLCRTCHQK